VTKQKTTKGVTVWFTGLPCSGKTTVAIRVADVLRSKGYPVEHLDGDVVRKSLTKDLGFSKADREENLRRITELARQLTEQGNIVLATFVSPYRDRREKTRAAIPSFYEVYARCPVEVCIKRDVKGMYKQALEGRLKGFTGVDDPYEEPLHPDLILDTNTETVNESTHKVLEFLRKKGFLPG
jgi:adenylylsulfate kinase